MYLSGVFGAILLLFDVTFGIMTSGELLCFISQKRNVMAVDDMIKICTDFYKEEEIVAAKALLEQSLPERLTKRQGPNKCRGALADLNDPNMSLPTYFAADLKRSPPVSVDHGDISAILAELQYLLLLVLHVSVMYLFVFGE